MSASTENKILMPFPPSLNSLFPGKQRRHKSKAYEAWIREAGYMLLNQKHDRFDCPISVSYFFGRPDKRKRDLDNLFKAPNDFLVSSGVIADDSLIHRICGEWADVEGCLAVIKTVD